MTNIALLMTILTSLKRVYALIGRAILLVLLIVSQTSTAYATKTFLPLVDVINSNDFSGSPKSLMYVFNRCSALYMAGDVAYEVEKGRSQNFPTNATMRAAWFSVESAKIYSNINKVNPDESHALVLKQISMMTNEYLDGFERNKMLAKKPINAEVKSDIELCEKIYSKYFK